MPHESFAPSSVESSGFPQVANAKEVHPERLMQLTFPNFFKLNFIFSLRDDSEIAACLIFNGKPILIAMLSLLKLFNSGSVFIGLSFFVIQFLISSEVNANHIAGGDFSVQHVEDNIFEATLILYRDCEGNLVVDQTINIAVFDAVTNVYLPSVSFTMSNPSQQNILLANDCYDTGLCIDAQIYTALITLPNNPNGYYMSWERCCRNELALNVNATNQGMVFTTEVPDPALQNSSPQFAPYPSETFLCVNSETVLDFSATDADGDSLVYSLITPLRGNGTSQFAPTLPQGALARPYPPLDWTALYDLDDPVGGDIPFTIDPQTGLGVAQPTSIGSFSLAVKVEEFRDGVKIGEVIREAQLASLICVVDEASTIEIANGDTIFDIIANTGFCIDIVITTPNEGDTLFVEVDGDLFDGTVFPPASFPASEGFSVIEEQFCWSPVCDNLNFDEGLYEVTISAFSRGCANEILVTTQTLYFNVYIEDDEPTAIAEPTLPDGLPGVLIDLYNPSTHCFDFVFQDPNEADSLQVTASSPIFNLPNVTAVEPGEDQGTISLPFCWDVTCADVRDEPYIVTFEVITTNCEVEEINTFEIPVFVIVPDNEPTIFQEPFQDTYTFEFYSANEFEIPVIVTDANFFDTLNVTASSPIFSLPQNPAIFDSLNGLSVVEGAILWSPACEAVRPEPYTVTLTATAQSCKTDDTVSRTIEIFLELPPESAPFFELPNPGELIEHTVGDELIDILVIARDNDSYDTLTLTATSPAFQSRGRAAVMESATSTQFVSSNFIWDPLCPDISEAEIPVRFEVNSRSCQKDVSRFLDISITVTTPTRGDIAPIANVITPNGDGRNDAWIIEHLDDVCLLNFRALVIDRWGKQVFESEDPKFQWDGQTPNGNLVSGGNYFQTIQYFYKDRTVSYTGNVTVLEQ